MGAQILGGEALHTRSGFDMIMEGVVARNEAHARRQGPHEPTEGGMRRYDVPEERGGAEGWGRWRGGTSPSKNGFSGQECSKNWSSKFADRNSYSRTGIGLRARARCVEALLADERVDVHTDRPSLPS